MDVATTKFKLIFETDPPDIDIELFGQSMPRGFLIDNSESEIYISVPSSVPEDKSTQYLIDRELDRHRFLTTVNIKAELVTKRVRGKLQIRYRRHEKLNDDIKPQKWNYELPIQLRLWSVAIDAEELLLKVILYFQIIELSYQSKKYYPVYQDTKIPPNPLTECKLLRNMAAHSGKAASAQQKLYCEHLGIRPSMHDPTDLEFIRIFQSKIKLLKSEAKKAIEQSLN